MVCVSVFVSARVEERPKGKQLVAEAESQPASSSAFERIPFHRVVVSPHHSLNSPHTQLFLFLLLYPHVSVPFASDFFVWFLLLFVCDFFFLRDCLTQCTLSLLCSHYFGNKYGAVSDKISSQAAAARILRH